MCRKNDLVSNIMMTDAGMLVRAVGNGEQFPAERKNGCGKYGRCIFVIGWKQILDREWGKKNGTFGTFLYELRKTVASKALLAIIICVWASALLTSGVRHAQADNTISTVGCAAPFGAKN